jgi:hypothetical protein
VIRILLAVTLALMAAVTPALAQPAVTPALAQPAAGIDVTVDPSGHYTVDTHAPEMTFEGNVGQPVSGIHASDGQNPLGVFHEVDFDYGGRTSAIVAYPERGAVIFSTTYTAANASVGAFPVLTQVPSLPFALSYHDAPFSPYQLNTVADAADSPWLFFDAGANGFVISPASDFLISRMELRQDGVLTSSVTADLRGLSGSLPHQTVLVVGTGLNHLFDAWGQTLTGLHGKPRPPNDADLTLEKFGYWTDNGAAYYYRFEPQYGYAGTLLAVRHELDQRGIGLGYLQLDSWWYPKGPNARWDDTRGGIYQYRAAPELFPSGLATFQQQVGLPLVTHARWIDPASPYRAQYGFSGNVMTDPRYWTDLMSYLHSSGVVTYEQDWLGAQAQPVYDLTAPTAFMGNMASDAVQAGLTLQYCMPLPRQVLQTVEYGNVTSMRVSDDRFDRTRWDSFLYTSRLASAVGVWPWSDVFMSTERDNLVLSLLSGGVVGIGDALGAENTDNIRHVMRADAVLIKPDASLAPTDDSILEEAASVDRQTRPPMVAWTYSDHAVGRAAYVFAYSRSAGGGSQHISLSPTTLGVPGAAYIYNYFDVTGRVVQPGEAFTDDVTDGTYYVVAPVGPSGIAFLGDSGEFATLGVKRISALSDDGAVHTTVEFAAGESSVTLLGYAPSPPAVSTSGGSAELVNYDPGTNRFSVVIHPDRSPSSVTVGLGR